MNVPRGYILPPLVSVRANPEVKVLAPEPYTALFEHQEIFGLPKREGKDLGEKVIVTDSINHAPLFFVSVTAD